MTSHEAHETGRAEEAASKADWGKTASEYARHAQGFTERYIGRAIDDAIAALPSKITDEKKIKCLDIACGTGAATFILAQALSQSHPNHQVHITATDLSEDMLSHVQRQMGKWSMTCPNVTIKTSKLDMHDLSEIPSGSMDLVVMTFGIMFSENPDQAIKEIQRVLAPTGIAVITTWSWNSVVQEVIQSLVEQGKVERASDVRLRAMDFGNSLHMLKLSKHAGVERASCKYIQFQDGYPFPISFLAHTINNNPGFAEFAPVDEEKAEEFFVQFSDGSDEYGPYRLVYAVALCLQIGF